MWILKYHFCGSNDMSKWLKFSSDQWIRTSQISKRSFLSSATAWEDTQTAHMEVVLDGEDLDQGEFLDGWSPLNDLQVGETQLVANLSSGFFFDHVFPLRTHFNGSLADMARTASEGTVSLSTRMIAIEDAMTEAIGQQAFRNAPKEAMSASSWCIEVFHLHCCVSSEPVGCSYMQLSNSVI